MPGIDAVASGDIMLSKDGILDIALGLIAGMGDII